MKCIMEMVIWLNVNDGCAMAILTFVYVIATIFICRYNAKSASATKEQIKESQRQFEENIRANVIPRFITLEGQLYCLAFHNVGKTMANKLIINISKEWIECLRKTKKNYNVADTLDHLRDIEIFLPIDDKYVYSICVPADGTGDFATLCEKPLKITIDYYSGDKPYHEEYELPMKGINCIINTSDYVRIEQKKIESLNDIGKHLQKLQISNLILEKEKLD